MGKKAKAGKGNSNSKAASKPTIAQIYSEAGREACVDIMLEAGYDLVGDMLGEDAKLSVCNNTIPNNVVMAGAASALMAEIPESADVRVKKAGEYFFGGIIRNSHRNIVNGMIGTNGDITVFIKDNILSHKESAEAVDQLIAEDAKIEAEQVKLSSAKADTVVEEKPEPLPIITKDNASAGGRLMGTWDSVDAAEGMIRVLKEGVPGNDQLAPPSKKLPIGCQADGCSAVLTEHKQLHAAYDQVAGKAGIFCEPCKAKIDANNALVADGKAGDSLVSEETTIELTDAEIEDLKAEFKRLAENVDITDQHFKHLQREADQVLAHLEQAESNQQKFKKAVDAGVDELAPELTKAEEDLALLTKQSDELADSTKAAQAALAKAKTGMVEFSTANRKHLNLINDTADGKFDLPEEEGGSGNKVETKLDIKGEQAKSEGKGADPFKGLKATDKCKCGSGRYYKNCCGRRAFCNPKNGKVRSAKPGDIRRSVWLAKHGK